MYFNVYVGTVLSAQFLFKDSFQYAAMILERIGKDVIENNHVTSFIQLLCLQSSEWSIEGMKAIETFLRDFKELVFIRARRMDMEFPYPFPARYCDFFYGSIFHFLNTSKFRNQVFRIESATNLSEDYCFYLGIPKMQGIRVVDYIKLSNPIVSIHFSDFFKLYDEITGLEVKPFDDYETNGFYFVNFLVKIFTCLKPLTIIPPKEVKYFFEFVRRIPDFKIKKGALSIVLQKFIKQVSDLEQYTIDNLSDIGVIFAEPSYAQKLDTLYTYM